MNRIASKLQSRNNRRTSAPKFRRLNPLSVLRTAPRGFQLFFGFVALVMVGSIGFGIFQAASTNTVAENCIVADKSITFNTQTNKSDMRIYTENCGTFQVGDNPLKGVWNSADLYGAISKGETYDFQTTGVRVGLVSAFPTIYQATPAN